MSENPAILVLHGITMSGRSMLRLLGPIADALRARGLDLIAPEAGHRLSADAIANLLPWLERTYRERGQDAHDFFNKNVFWDIDDPDARYDWFDSRTVDDTRIYAGLGAGLERIREACAGRTIVGILGFSQGCAMAALTAGLARRGHLGDLGRDLRLCLLFAGFRPTFDQPVFDPPPWPVDLPALLIWGRRDPVFPEEATIRGLAAEFREPELLLLDDLSHDLPRDPGSLARLVAFTESHLR